jgi:hypothetical protein
MFWGLDLFILEVWGTPTGLELMGILNHCTIHISSMRLPAWVGTHNKRSLQYAPNGMFTEQSCGW